MLANRFIRDPWSYGYEHPFRIFDQNFGTGLFDDQLLPAIVGGGPSAYALAHQRPRRLHSQKESGTSQVEVTKDSFLVKLDVQHFSPEEVTVKTVDNFVVIEGKHEEKQDDHGFISRHFIRRYMLPNWANAENVVCNMSSDGVLSITAAKPVAVPIEGKEQVIRINQTGQPAAVCAGPCSDDQQKQA